MLVAILLGAGASERAGEDKAFADLAGMPLLRWGALRLAAHPRVDAIVAVVRADAIDRAIAALAEVPKLERVVAGGATRAASAVAGIEATDCASVLVHDAARPFLDAATLDRVIAALDAHGAAAAALPVADTIRGGDEWAGATLAREALWAMQTPQAFARRTLLDAYRRAAEPPTDCAAAVVAAGGRVRLVPGSRGNFKVTTADDLAFARALAAGGAVRPAGEAAGARGG